MKVAKRVDIKSSWPNFFKKFSSWEKNYNSVWWQVLTRPSVMIISQCLEIPNLCVTYLKLTYWFRIIPQQKREERKIDFSSNFSILGSKISLPNQRKTPADLININLKLHFKNTKKTQQTSVSWRQERKEKQTKGMEGNLKIAYRILCITLCQHLLKSKWYK